MTTIGGIIAIQLVALTAYLLYKKYTASLTLLGMGMLMLLLSSLMDINIPGPEKESYRLLGIFRKIAEAFSIRASGAGLLIMMIGGYVEYMKRIRASDALVYVSMQPLSVLKKYPYLAAVIVIPIGQLLFLAIPSAVGLGLLLITTVYPVLLGIGVSRLTALSVISACTVFDLGITSSNSAVASEILMMDITHYFTYQIRIVVPLMVLMMFLFYFSNRYFDKQEAGRNNNYQGRRTDISLWKNSVPLSYAVLPALPLLLTILFSRLLPPSRHGLYLNTATAILISFFIAGVFDLAKRKSVRETFSSMNIFGQGMGRTFITVIVLLVAADIFSQGLIRIGFIDFMLHFTQSCGFGSVGVTILLSILTFIASIITGSGIASFTAFGNTIPDIAFQTGIPDLSLMLPVQLIAGIARAASPIAVVLIAISEIAGVSPFALSKRNLLPILAISLTMLLLTFINL